MGLSTGQFKRYVESNDRQRQGHFLLWYATIGLGSIFAALLPWHSTVFTERSIGNNSRSINTVESVSSLFIFLCNTLEKWYPFDDRIMSNETIFVIFIRLFVCYACCIRYHKRFKHNELERFAMTDSIMPVQHCTFIVTLHSYRILCLLMPKKKLKKSPIAQNYSVVHTAYLMNETVVCFFSQ